MIACRILAVGTESNLDAFVASENWPSEFKAPELLESSPRRRLWQFEVQRTPVAFLRSVSLRHPSLTLVLDYDTAQVKGIVGVKNGKARRCLLRYLPNLT